MKLRARVVCTIVFAVTMFVTLMLYEESNTGDRLSFRPRLKAYHDTEDRMVSNQSVCLDFNSMNYIFRLLSFIHEHFGWWMW